VARSAFPTKGDKSIRAQSIRGRMALNSLYVPTHAAWYPALRSELLTFPAGRNDDCVDSLALVGQLLDKMQSGPRLRAVEKPIRDRWEDRYERREKSSVDWKVV
jgi:hypothetical protein